MSVYLRDKRKDTPHLSIPWAMIQEHEEQALDNHCGQSLERLAQRGGLSPSEAFAVLRDQSWKRNEIGEEASYNEIIGLLLKWTEKYLDNLPSEVNIDI